MTEERENLKQQWIKTNEARIAEIMSSLTDDWQPFTALKHVARWHYFDTLCQYGLIECNLEQFQHDDSYTSGTRHYYRLKQEA